MPNPDAVMELARLCGIEAEFYDARGQRHVASPEALSAILAAMGYPAESDAEIREATAAIEAEARERLAPEAVIARGGAGWVGVPGAVEWRLELDGGEVLEGAAEGGIELSGLPIGLHRLAVIGAGRGSECTILACPGAAPSSADLTGRSRVWGIAAPLYGLRSERNLGLGTYDDLAELAEATAPMGADYLAINPIHALFPTAPDHFSPYSPSHRRFANPAHIAPGATPDFAASAAARAWMDEHATAIETLRRAELVDYPAVAAILNPLFERMYDAFEATAGPGSPRGVAFADWCAARGAELDRFAVYEALSEELGAFWPSWPEPYRRTAAPEVAAFAAANGRRVRFHKYLQWLAAEQLEGAQARAMAAGMGLGLVSDLAVGIHPAGAEIWAEPGDFGSGVSLGAPPDSFNHNGQNWALAPFRPTALRRNGYRAFAETLGQSMRWCGAIRIDHIVGFTRAYWIPDGHQGGAYVHYPIEELLAIGAIEGHKRKCLVIGEDLGNVPDGLRDQMNAIGIHGFRLVYFEREHDGTFRGPDQYQFNTNAALGCHDLPSFKGWWEEGDIDLRVSLGMSTDDEAMRDREHRSWSRGALLAALRNAGIEFDDVETDAARMGDNLMLAVHRFLAITGSELATVQAENAFAIREQLNLPGTVDQHPNWRRRIPPAADWRASELFRQIARIMSEERPRQPH